MLLKLESPKLFSDIISIIHELVLEVRIKVNKDGMSILAIDPANVAMVVFKLPPTAFSEFKVEGEEILGVSLDNLKSVLRRCSAKSLLILEKEENMLNVQIHDKIKREFRLSLIEIEDEEKEIPNLSFEARVEMPSVDFSEAIEDCAVVADSCNFVTNPDKFMIKAKGALNSFKSEFSDEINLVAQDADSTYSLEYLQKIIKATKITDKTILNFSSNYPLKIEFNTPLVELSFILAPRVKTDE